MTAALDSALLAWTAVLIYPTDYVFSLCPSAPVNSCYNFDLITDECEIIKCLQEFKEEEQDCRKINII
jgi:hypothetical protein